MSDVRTILEMKEPGFFAYVTENQLLKFKYCHVFSLKRPVERGALITDMKSVINEKSAINEDGGKIQSVKSDQKTFSAHYVGNVTGSDLARSSKKYVLVVVVLVLVVIVAVVVIDILCERRQVGPGKECQETRLPLRRHAFAFLPLV